MAVRRSSPTVGRRRLGIELRRLRDQAGVTIEAVADRLECSSSKISRIETGHIGASPRDVRDMLAIYGVSGEPAEELVRLARDSRQKGWWQMYGTVLTGAYVGLEAAAARVHAYEALVFPGLLQTSDYAREVIRAARPDITAENLDRRIDVRTRRQSLLNQEDPLHVWAILDEAVFHRVVGSTAVMRGQLEHVLARVELPGVTVQVLPFAAGAHAGMDGTFAILEYDEDADRDVVFAENAAGGLFLEKDDELERYKTIFRYLQETALPPEQSAEFVSAKAKEFH